MWKLSICLFLAVAFVSCSSNPSNNSTGVPTQPLIPLAQGNTWIYADTIFATAADTVYPDTVVINANQLQFTGPNGTVTLYGVTESDTTGIFAGTYLGLDPSNTAIWQYDSVSNPNEPYVYFETATADNTNLGTGAGPVVSGCTEGIAQYGYVSTTVINGHTCLKNIVLTYNCSNAIVEQDDIYIDPGIGLVRFDDYQLNASGVLTIDFSQTLVSDTL